MLVKAPKIEFWHKSKIKRGSNIRKSRDQDELRRLGESYKRRWIMPLLVMADGTLIDGEGRFLGGCLAGMEEFPVQVVEGALGAHEIEWMQLTSVLQRADLPDYDKAVAMRNVQQAHPELTGKQIAEGVLHIDPSSLTRYLSLFGCINAVIEAASAGQLTVTKWYALSKLSAEQQPAALALALNGATLGDIAKHVKQHANAGDNGEADSVRLKRVACALPGGVSVTLAGKEMNLSTLIKSLTDLLREGARHCLPCPFRSDSLTGAHFAGANFRNP
jgi:ParB-like chromosome segregation protein Spo0J